MTKEQSRQSFLGPQSEEVLQDVRVAIVGLGGGGSHIAQQLAHIGVRNFVLFDPQRIESTNLNRLIGATAADVAAGNRKIDIAARLIAGIRPDANIDARPVEWQVEAEALRDCDVVFGSVDSYKDRSALERVARRYLIPYIDIGMDVHTHGSRFHMCGQIALSIPGQACLWCMGLLRDNLLAEEAGNYGAAGVRQQVVWPNGVLASSAVGMFMALILPWSERPASTLLEYDGDLGTVASSRKAPYLPAQCKHFIGESDLGDPFWKMWE